MGKNSPSPPPPPDYRGAAQETAAGNLEATRAATQANRFNQYTPYGSQIWTDQGNDRWRSDINLAPIAQQTLDTQMNLSNQMGDLTQQQIPGVQQQYSQPMDLSSVPQIADKAYGAMTSRLDPQWKQATGMEENKLVNQGLQPGMEAYDNAMRVFNQGKNDAYQQANLASIATMPQTYQLETSTYNQPLNQLNALRTGAQIQNPQFQPAGMQGSPGGPNMLGAAGMQGQYDQGLFNANVGSQNAMTQGLFGIGAAAAGGLPWGKIFGF